MLWTGMAELSSALRFRKIDEACNMRRFYGLDAQPTLFGEWCAIQTWGRIGTQGQEKRTYFNTWQDAQGYLSAEKIRRQKRGYRSI